MSLNFSPLEEVHGGPFGGRKQIGQSTGSAEPIAKPEFTSLAQKSEESRTKNKALVDEISKTLPLDREPTTESFTVRRVEEPMPVVKRMDVREAFVDRPQSNADAAAEDKLARILRLIEQNKTGYERPAVQDMVLYIFTGVFFLFTFDTFVQIGKTMGRGKKA